MYLLFKELIFIFDGYLKLIILRRSIRDYASLEHLAGSILTVYVTKGVYELLINADNSLYDNFLPLRIKLIFLSVKIEPDYFGLFISVINVLHPYEF